MSKLMKKMLNPGRLVLLLVCVSIAGRSQGANGFCFDRHEHAPREHTHHSHEHQQHTHHTHEHEDCDDHCRQNDIATNACCCESSNSESDDCIQVSVLPDEGEGRLASVPAVSISLVQPPQIDFDFVINVNHIQNTTHEVLSIIHSTVIIA